MMIVGSTTVLCLLATGPPKRETWFSIAIVNYGSETGEASTLLLPTASFSCGNRSQGIEKSPRFLYLSTSPLTSSPNGSGTQLSHQAATTVAEKATGSTTLLPSFAECLENIDAEAANDWQRG
jgi:hypothetical protein